MRRQHLLLALVIAVVLLLAGVGIAAYVQAGKAVDRFEAERPLPGAALYAQDGTLIKRLGEGSVFVPLEKIPRTVQDAVRASENKASGGQAITDRLAADIMQPQGFWQRLQFSFLPTVLNRRYEPDEQLEIYLNHADFGEQARGVEAASQTYFGKSVESVDLAESALLAALAQEPESASPFTRPKQAQELRNEILAQMERDNTIKQAARTEAAAEPLPQQKKIPGRAHFFADYVNDLLVDELGKDRVHAGGLEVETTLDLGLQELAESLFIAGQLQGALIALDPAQGHILAMVGGLDYEQDRNNLATAKQKDVGGSLRPLLYATGLVEGWAMNHLVEDVQRKFDDFEVRNWDERYWGAVTMKHALTFDLNNAAVWTLNRLGVDKLTTLAAKVDLKFTENDQDLALAMGQTESGLSLLEVTAAYLPGPKAGQYIKPTPFLAVKDGQDRNALNIQADSETEVFTEQQAYLFTNMLFPAAERLDLGFEAALKISQTEDETDQSAIGYTPRLLVGVFVRDAEEENAAAEVWAQFVQQAEERTEGERDDFTVPDDVETDVLIDVFTGLLASERCPQVELDAFIAGTKPTALAPCALPPPPPEPVRPPSRTVPPATQQLPPPTPEPEEPEVPAAPVEPEPPAQVEEPAEPEEPEQPPAESEPEPAPEEQPEPEEEVVVPPPEPEMEPEPIPEPETEPAPEVGVNRVGGYPLVE